MPVCPYENHRLRLSADRNCQRCGNDLTLYAGIQEAAISCFNEARRLWDEDNIGNARAWTEMALRLNSTFPEALWLMAAILARDGSPGAARAMLKQAQSLGAKVDPDWIAGIELEDTPQSAAE
jgi:uncharacterized membrane-anchored protein